MELRDFIGHTLSDIILSVRKQRLAEDRQQETFRQDVAFDLLVVPSGDSLHVAECGDSGSRLRFTIPLEVRA